MPSEFIIDEKVGLVFSKGLGVFTPQDYFDHMTQLGRDARFKTEFNQIIDCRSISEMKLNAEQIRGLAERSIFSVHSKRAFLGSTDMQVGMSRMLAAYQEMQGRPNVKVSRDLADALAWLDLPGDYDPYRNVVTHPPTRVG